MKFKRLLDELDPNWSYVEKARKLYWEICKIISYDDRFALGRNQNLLYEIYNRDVDIEEDISDLRFVCNSSNKLYKKLLDELGIPNKLITKKASVDRPIDVDDVALIFYDENGDSYFTNIVGDIQNCKYGTRTMWFGNNNTIYPEGKASRLIPDEELKQMDLKMGNIHRDYYDIVFILIRDEVKNTEHFKKFLRSQGVDTKVLSRDQILKYKIDYMSNFMQFQDDTAGPDEIKKYYRKLFMASVLDKFESKQFKAYEFVKEKADGEVDLLSCLEINLEEGPLYYVYSNDSHGYHQIPIEKLQETIKDYRERKGKRIIADKRNKSIGDEEPEL